MNAIKCLHIPELHESEHAVITWEALQEATGYQLECIYDNSFENGKPGLRWGDLVRRDSDWSDFEEKDLVWEQLLVLLPIDTVYDGPGAPYATAGQGLTWHNIAEEDRPWSGWAALQLAWQNFMQLFTRGLAWENIHHNNYDWNLLMEPAYSWQDIKERPITGLAWDGLTALRMDWSEIANRDYTWKDFGKVSHNEEHLGCEHEIALKTETAQFRLRAYNATAYSDYITSLVCPVIPRFVCEDTLEWEVLEGEQYYVQLDAIAAQTGVLEDILMNIRYSPELILQDLCAQLPEEYLEIGEIPDAMVDLVLHDKNRIQLRCVRDVPKGLEWSGLITLFSFYAVADGIANLELSR